MTKITPSSYLDHAQLVHGRNSFAVGIFERGITLYRQQMRALNLIHAMLMSKKKPSFKPGAKVAVIGGGAFGMTAAAAAAWVGYEVKLYERHPVLLPFQSGCDTRWINPHYYDWPSAGAESRFAALPLMNWQAGTASQVADQLVREFLTHTQTTGRLKYLIEVTGLKVEMERHGNNPETYVVSCRHKAGQDEWRCDVMIYATGFGLERDIGSKTASYWRNDHFGQLDLHIDGETPNVYVVSGIGDSGLTDLFRLKIINFRHEHIFYELFEDARPELIARLRAIQRGWEHRNESQPDWLYTQFEKLVLANPAEELIEEVSKRLSDRLRKDTLVFFNGKAKRFCDALSLRRSSLSNALLAFLLFKLNAFSYKSGRLTKSANRWQIGAGAKAWKLPSKAQLIVRHGTERKVPLAKMGLNRANKVLAKRADLDVDTASQIFPHGWWAQRRANDPSSAGVEFVPPITVTLASTFVSTLADILSDRLLTGRPSVEPGSEPRFRLTLHRVTRFGEREVFHQIAPYAGRLQDQQTDGFGRIFTVQGGLVGLAIRTGRSVIFRRDELKFEEMKTRTNFERLLAHPIQKHVRSMVATPFSVAAKEAKTRIGFVMFADSSKKEFFDKETLGTIYAACTGFVRNVENMLDSGRLREVSSDYPGYEVSDSALSDANIREFNSVGITFDSEEFARYKEGLTFKNLSSFDFDVGFDQLIRSMANVEL